MTAAEVRANARGCVRVRLPESSDCSRTARPSCWIAAARSSESSAPRRRQKDGASTKVEPYAPSAQSEALFCRCCAVVFLSSLSLVCTISCAVGKAMVALPTATTSCPPTIAHVLAHDPYAQHNAALLLHHVLALVEKSDMAGNSRWGGL